MSETRTELTITFEPPFWVGVCERYDGDKYTVSKIVFGAEPNDTEVLARVLNDWDKLKFSPPIKQKEVPKQRINPKRLQRKIADKLSDGGIGTKAQQAMKLLHDESKMQREKKSKAQREQEKARLYDIAKVKRKQKHNGH